jgi:hypothetical protein
LQYYQPERFRMLIFLQQWLVQPQVVLVVLVGLAVELGQVPELVEPQE